MKTIYKYILPYFLILGLLMGCTKDFEDINTNPNEPVDVPTAYLFTQAERNSMEEQFYYTTLLYAQLLSETQYTNTSRYDTEEASFDDFYSGPLADLQTIINLNTDEETKDDPFVAASGANQNQIAVARILKAYNFQIVTDMWGDVPYTDALQFADNFQAAYTPQEEIYADLVKELTEASAQIDEAAAGIVGDQIYAGDMTAWKKFANSLLLRVGIRMSEVNPTLAQQAIQTAMTNGVFASNDDNALYAYLSNDVNANPVYDHFNVDNRTDYGISNVLTDYMKSLNDPRLFIYGEPTESSVLAGTPEIVGMPYGLNDAKSGSITNASISFPGVYWKEEASQPGIIMSYSEVLFIMAEAAARGWVSGDAAALYSQAVTAAMNYYGITDQAAISAYLAQPAVAYDAVNYKMSIGNQKWIALYAVGHEPWSEWRRLGYPALSPAPDAASGRGIPLRRTYAQREFQLNEESVTAAVTRQLGQSADNVSLSTPVWWDK